MLEEKVEAVPETRKKRYAPSPEKPRTSARLKAKRAPQNNSNAMRRKR
jgi:hypothetical protein